MVAAGRWCCVVSPLGCVVEGCVVIKWTQHYALGVHTLDRQHRELFRRMNRLGEQLNVDASKELVDELLRFLLVYVDVHFNEEEQFMQLHEYPHLEEHRQAHADFVQRVEQFMHEDRDRYSQEELRSLVVDWISTHVLRADLDFGRYLETRSVTCI